MNAINLPGNPREVTRLFYSGESESSDLLNNLPRVAPPAYGREDRLNQRHILIHSVKWGYIYIHAASGTARVQKVWKTGSRTDVGFVAGLKVTGTPRQSASKALVLEEYNWAVLNGGCVSREEGNHTWGRGSAARHLTLPPRHWHPPTSPHFLHHFHGHSIPGTLAHFQSLTPTWIQQWPPLEGCTASPHPRQPWPGILALSPSPLPTHSHVCAFPRGPRGPGQELNARS